MLTRLVYVYDKVYSINQRSLTSSVAFSRLVSEFDLFSWAKQGSVLDYFVVCVWGGNMATLTTAPREVFTEAVRVVLEAWPVLQVTIIRHFILF